MTWIQTMGDPVESALLTYRNYYDMPIPPEGENVDERLINYYRELSFMSLLWTALDPAFYESLMGFRTKMHDNFGIISPKMIGNDNFSWMYGTLFNISPLGYELHFLNHIRLKGNYACVSFHYGRPFDNMGVSIHLPQLYRSGRMAFGANADYWYQEPFGHGAGASLSMDAMFTEKFGASLTTGWKSRGYLLGMPVASGPVIRGGILFRIPW